MRAKAGYGVPLVVLTILLGARSRAWAAVPPRNRRECVNHKAGDACLDDQMQAGVCTADKCTVLDYSDGSPPGTKVVDCLVCKAGASSSSSSGSGGGSGSSSG